jgi:hypothetical protein
MIITVRLGALPLRRLDASPRASCRMARHSSVDSSGVLISRSRCAYGHHRRHGMAGKWALPITCGCVRCGIGVAPGTYQPPQHRRCARFSARFTVLETCGDQPGRYTPPRLIHRFQALLMKTKERHASEHSLADLVMRVPRGNPYCACPGVTRWQRKCKGQITRNPQTGH